MKADVTLLVATGRVLIMPKYQPTNPNFEEEEDLFDEKMVDNTLLDEESRSLPLRNIELEKRVDHLDCWS